MITTKLNKSTDQQKVLLAIQKAIRTAVEQEIKGTSTRITEATITIDALQPTGWNIVFKVALQVSPLDVKVEDPTAK